MRDPTTEGHSRRVAVLTVGLAKKVERRIDRAAVRHSAQRDQLEELRYAALLHDFGKVAVEEKYLKKSKKLYATELIGLRQRFAYIAKANEVDYLRAQLEAMRVGSRDSPEQLAALEADYQQRTRRDRSRAQDGALAPMSPRWSSRMRTSWRSWICRAAVSEGEWPTRRMLRRGELGTGALPELATRRKRSRSARAASPSENVRDQRARQSHLRVPQEDPVDG